MNFRSLLTLFASWVVLCGIGHGQMIDTSAPGADAVPQEPANGVIDNAGFFQLKPELLARITRQIADLEQRHGFKLRLYVEGTFIGDNFLQVGDALQNAWCPDGNGMVVVFEADTRRIAIGRNTQLGQDFSSNKIDILTHEKEAIASKLKSDLDPSKPSEEYLDELIARAHALVLATYKAKEMKPPAKRERNTLIYALACLAVVSGLFIIINRLSNRSRTETVSADVLRFRESRSNEILDAPCGVKVTSYRFGDPRQG